MTRIRVATPADAERIGEIHDAAVRAFGPEAYDDAQIEVWTGSDGSEDSSERDDATDAEARESDGAMPEDDDHWIVAEREGSVAGWGRIDADAGEITGSYVHPDHARSGVGATIIAALEGYARGKGLEEVHLAASKNAVGFYERLGYAGVGTVEHGTEEVAIDCQEMRKEL